MSNPFFYLAGLLLATAYPLGVEPLEFVRRMVTPWAVAGSLAVYASLCWAVLGRRPRRPSLARLLLQGAALALYAELVFVFHLPLWVSELGAIGDDPLAGSLITLSPLMAFFGILALIYNRVEPHAGGLRFAFRSFVGLSLLPLLLMLGLDEAFERIWTLRRLAYLYPAAGWGAALGGLAILMVFLPPLLRLILGARPLAAGPLRSRLERVCDEAGFHADELLVVPTGSSRMANAFVAGLSASWRYVFFTGAILEGMSPEELECVLLHEITHAQKRHLTAYLTAALAFSLLSGLAHEALSAAGVPSPVLLVLILAWAGLYWGGAFFYVSRRFETEADLVAARLAPAAEGGLLPYRAARRMAAALERVAELNQVPLEAFSWRHFTLARRIEILLEAELRPLLGVRLEQVCARFRGLATGLLLVGLLAGGIHFGLEQGRARENLARFEADEAVLRGFDELKRERYPEALTDLRQGIERGAESAAAWIWVADCEQALGHPEQARAAEATARRLGVTDPRFRLRLQ